MGRLPMAAALALAFSSPLAAGVEVTASGNRMDVTADQAPLSEVLDGLARRTRMKVVYEGPAPRTPVTVEIRDRTHAQAVLGVLEGLGLNYALVLDASGTEVEILMIMGAAGAKASAAPARAARTGRPDPREVDEEAAMVEREEPSEVEAGVPAAAPEVPRVDEGAKVAPAPAHSPPGPLDPMGFRAGPFAPGPLPLVTPSPNPNQNQPPGPNQAPRPNQPSSN